LLPIFVIKGCNIKLEGCSFVSNETSVPILLFQKTQPSLDTFRLHLPFLGGQETLNNFQVKRGTIVIAITTLAVLSW
jgi:hypothetical protein